jgi:hypothetical protein
MPIQSIKSFFANKNEVQTGESVEFTYVATSKGDTNNAQANISSGLATFTPTTYINNLVSGENTIKLPTKITVNGNGLFQVKLDLNGHIAYTHLIAIGTLKKELIESINTQNNISVSFLQNAVDASGKKYFTNKSEIYKVLKPTFSYDASTKTWIK